MYYLNSRFYDQEIGRFISADAIDIITATAGTLTEKNLYAYCNNNPVSNIDLEGDFAIPALVLKVGVDVATSMATAYLIARTTGQDIRNVDLLLVGLSAGLSSASLITSGLAAALSGVGTFFDMYGEYSMGAALLAAGIDVFVSCAGYTATLQKFIPEGEVIVQSMVAAVFGMTDGYLTEGANLLIEACATPQPQRLVIKELIRKDEDAGKPTYMKSGNSCVLI